MSGKAWYLHVAGEALGPFSTSVLTKMLEQQRANAGDFVWCEGLTEWIRIAECAEFKGVLPEAPAIPVPEAPTAPPPKASKPAPPPPPPAAPKKPAAENAKPPAPPPSDKHHWRVPIKGTVHVNGSKATLFDISEGGTLFQRLKGLDVGADVKLRIESPAFPKPLELTGVVVREASFEGKPALGVEFTRMNPAHRRLIAQYIESKLALKAEPKAA